MRKTEKMLLCVFQFAGCVVRGRKDGTALNTADVLIKVKKIVYCIQLILSNNNTETIIIYLVLFVGVCCFPACQSVVVTMVVDNLGLLFDANRSVL